VCRIYDSFFRADRLPKKLGLLGRTFEDGTFAIYAVPDPSDVVSPDHDQSYPVCGISNSFTIQLLRFTYSFF
jgi:hypothetical protein